MNTKSNNSNSLWAIVGGGSGGLAVAGFLGSKNIRVRMLTHSFETIEAISKSNGVVLSGAINCFGSLELATNDPEKVIPTATIIMIVLPATYHEQRIKEIAPYLSKNQLIVLHPGMTFGALACQRTLQKLGINTKLFTIAETQTLLFACRQDGPASTVIYGIKKSVSLATIPSSLANSVVEKLHYIFPEFAPVENTLITGIGNINAVIHPAPTLLNFSRLDSKESWLFFQEGITPSIGSLMEKIDNERIAVGKMLGVVLPSLKELYGALYDAQEESLYEIFQGIESYKKFPGPNEENTRYLTEDIPYGLVPIADLSRVLSLTHRYMDSIIELANCLLNQDFKFLGRNLSRLGLEGLSSREIMEIFTFGLSD